MKTVKVFVVGMFVGIVGLMLLGEPTGARVMAVGAKMRHASASVSEYDGTPAQRFVEETSQRKVRR